MVEDGDEIVADLDANELNFTAAEPIPPSPTAQGGVGQGGRANGSAQARCRRLARHGR
ncbi:hypothetical protein AAFX91_38930 [Bradyrhizobium sp. 31Argb]|uniref:hypothetical protein n=1 Tax=Bradyrhizobium sp. 31Argb TaxID=3141247 RepID=UPI00374868F4